MATSPPHAEVNSMGSCGWCWRKDGLAKFALLMAARKSIGSRHSLSEREIFLHLRDIEQGLEQMKRLPLSAFGAPCRRRAAPAGSRAVSRGGARRDSRDLS
ncbi:POTRA domain-containing protein [Selenomonas bovis]|uniref:POTRA domain-containing protein n=1 Tax=Selenomonas bovis TaxID=416586 RepID=UPI003AB96224